MRPTAAAPTRRQRTFGLALGLALLLGGCAMLPAAAPAGAAGPTAAAGVASPAASSPGGGPATPAGPGQPPPFAVVAKDASASPGLLAVWRKDEKTWLELAPDDFGRPLFLSPKIATGIGERGFFGGLMASTWGLAVGQPQAVEFRRVNNQIQLLAVNTAYAAAAGTPQAHAVRAAFSPSLLASAAVASQPHPERKSVLVDAAALFVTDLPGLALGLQRNYRQSYALDARNSAIQRLRNAPAQLVIEVRNHYATAGLAVAPPNAPPGTPAPSVPSTLPDVRSLFITMHYSLTSLPDEPMRPRPADPRVGFFTTTVADFGDDLARSPKRRHVNRWRLEKLDPQAALSEPVKPITFWLDRSIPHEYRDAIRDGILAWNEAFERIGFKDALRVEVQPDDADFDTLDTQRASVRWMTNANAGFGAIGPSHVDPRSGEILDADIGLESLSSRSVRALRAQVLRSGPDDFAALLQPGAAPGHALDHDPRTCLHAEHAAEQLGYALDVLDARGAVDPDSPEARRFVLDYLKDVTMHEVGHTLGLRHNFRASRIYDEARLADPSFTRERGNSGSVMEYAPVNLAAPGQPEVAPFQATLGPYDFWAVEYAYKPIGAEVEAGELARIAARSAEPELAFGTDEDNSLGIDPEVAQFDLGRDPLAFAAKRMAIARELLERQEARELGPEDDYAVLRRSVGFAIRDVARAAGVLARQIGGVRTLRDRPGSGRDPLQPLEPETQRAALELLARGVLAADAFRLSPALQRRLAPDFLERGDALFEGGAPVATDFSLTQAVLDLQRALLNQLMGDAVATRLLDSETKLAAPAEAFRLSELHARLQREVWSELDGREAIPGQRRELQREHLNRVAALLLRPGAYSRADARGLLRAQAQELLGRVEAAARRTGLDADSRAHLLDSADTLRQALTARLPRAGA